MQCALIVFTVLHPTLLDDGVRETLELVTHRTIDEVLPTEAWSYWSYSQDYR